MSKPGSPADLESQLVEARTRRDGLTQSLLDMNGGDPDLYAAMGRNEGYDSLLCDLRGEQALIEKLNRDQSTRSKG